ncbi:MAG: DUF1080 domain-containing protein [Candidatus Brocadiae bacterium]|nr:DUF1080 domain-containing protein [Candidatus Brocadiia bacterium]
MKESRALRIIDRVLWAGILLAALLVTPLTAGAADTFQPGKDGWLTLFDGSEMARWTPSKGADWTIRDSVAVGTKGELVNYWYWVDFELIAELRGDGVLRCRFSDELLGNQHGYAIALARGTIRGAKGRVVAQGTGTATHAWRRLRIVASDGALTVYLDGKQVAKGADTESPERGAIALAAAGKPLELKLLRIRPLNREQFDNVPAPDKACFVCHLNFQKDKIARKHKARDEKKARGKHLRPSGERPTCDGCRTCHGASLDHRSDEDNVTAPDVLYTRGETDRACLTCHTPHKREKKRDNGNRTPPPENAVCTDCHGTHHTPAAKP